MLKVAPLREARPQNSAKGSVESHTRLPSRHLCGVAERVGLASLRFQISPRNEGSQFFGVLQIPGLGYLRDLRFLRGWVVDLPGTGTGTGTGRDNISR